MTSSSRWYGRKYFLYARNMLAANSSWQYSGLPHATSQVSSALFTSVVGLKRKVNETDEADFMFPPVVKPFPLFISQAFRCARTLSLSRLLRLRQDLVVAQVNVNPPGITSVFGLVLANTFSVTSVVCDLNTLQTVNLPWLYKRI